METLKLTPFDDVLDAHFGKRGVPGRDAFEEDVQDALLSYHIGEAIKRIRVSKKLTQEQLGALVGVKKAQISRIERGNNITVPTMSRIFKALGIASGELRLGRVGKVALW